jgi:hypothetical protein
MDDPLDAGGFPMKDWGWSTVQEEDEENLIGVLCRQAGLKETMRVMFEMEIAEMLRQRHLDDPRD